MRKTVQRGLDGVTGGSRLRDWQGEGRHPGEEGEGRQAGHQQGEQRRGRWQRTHPDPSSRCPQGEAQRGGPAEGGLSGGRGRREEKEVVEELLPWP